jgi:hypothetical protein
MHSLCVMCSPGIPRGAAHGPIRIIDIVPTLCRSTGFAPPSGAIGSALELPHHRP